MAGEWWNPVTWYENTQSYVAENFWGLAVPSAYATGGVLNEVTGGTTATYDPYSPDVQYNEPSLFVKAASVWDAGAGEWQIPFVNPYLPQAGAAFAEDVGDVADDLVPNVGKWLGAAALIAAAVLFWRK